MIFNETIIAPITPVGTISALAVVRLSGPETLDILQKLIFRPVSELEPRRTYRFHLYEDKTRRILIDDALIVYFAGKKSFCGEDTVEFHLHGSPLIVEQLIKTCLGLGARLAKKGEFSLKAVLNGKMSLLEAEQINALIHAPTERAKNRALSAMSRCYLQPLQSIETEIEYLHAYVLQILDYPEEYTEEKEALLKLDNIKEKVEAILFATKRNRLLFQGVKVAIIGEPNVGKSTLLNAILQEDKAIVSDEAGTTRDIVEGQREIEGVLFKFLDTAGIRLTTGTVEKIGIQKSYEAVHRSDIVLELSETGKYLSDKDSALKEILIGKKVIRLLTKGDVKNYSSTQDLVISAKDGKLDRLYSRMLAELDLDQIDHEGLFSVSDEMRLLDLLKTIDSARSDISSEHSFDLAAINLQAAHVILKEILGEEYDPSDIYDAVFKNFCVGK